MKIFLTLLMLFFAAFPVRAEEAVFAAGFEDLPVMAGLKQADDSSMSFDTPAGRIIEAYLEGDGANAAGVKAFYDKTLPQLGWKPLPTQKTGRFSFTREGELLTFTVDGKQPVTVRIELTTR